MFHLDKRHENTCLNCGTTHLTDLYCPHCGQENIEPKQSLGHLLTHFFNDVTHFDGKFFSTLKLLLIRPGFVSSEYIAGRRKKYLDPVRMYLFVSAVFLFLLLTVMEGVPAVNISEHPEYKQAVDSFRRVEYANDFNFFSEDLPGSAADGQNVFVYNLPDEMRHGAAYYDSVIKTRPDKDSWLKQYIKKKAVAGYQVYDSEPYNFLPKVIEGFRHSISKIAFISLPIFAFFLFLLYIRRRKQYYFVAHAIFSLHYYVVMFLVILFAIGCDELLGRLRLYDDVGGYIITFGLLVYLYIAMLRFYKQGWFKTLVKSLILYCFTIVTIFMLTLILFANSFLSVGSH